jgi:transcriptional regulator with XRE-family HTH domain
MPVQNPDFRRSVAAQMEDYKRRMAQTIKRERLRHGQKPADIAYKIGVDKRTYERWEEAETAPQPPNLRALADEWELDVSDLRPDLQGEAERLTRIEQMLIRLLAQAENQTIRQIEAEFGLGEDRELRPGEAEDG